MALALAACGGGGDGPQDRARVPPATTASPDPGVPGTTETSVPAATTAAACPTIPARAEPPADRPRYVLGVDVDPAMGTVRGDLKVAFTPDRPTAELVLRLWPNGPRPSLSGTRMETGPVTVDGVEVPVTQADATTLVVDPGRTIAAGTTVEIATTWTLAVPGPANDRIARDADSMRLGSFFPILPWEPGVGWAREAAVGDFAEASTAPTADFDLTVTVPDGYGVLASGEPVPPGSNHFRATAMRDVAVSIGRFGDRVTAVAHAPDPVQVTVGVHDGVPGDAQVFLDQVVPVLETFAERYGPYPWTTFTVAVTPGLGGGIEYPSHVMLGPFTEGDVTTHEVGHMWFYGLVGNDQGRDPWLDEGITTWAEARQQRTLADYTAQDIPRIAEGHLGEAMSFWTLRPLYYQDGVYTQGAQALAALGPPEMVDCALRVYVAQNAYRIATPADLVAAASSVFPDAHETLARFGIEP
jgi:hypothetical protein